MNLRTTFMLSTVPEKHDINSFIQLLKRHAALVLVGAAPSQVR
jgi:D-arabinose 1-dehydrogenase-like Zn-dependent alcohol dehydrogenase